MWKRSKKRVPVADNSRNEGARRAATLAFHYSGADRISRRILSARGKFALNLHGVSKGPYPEIPPEAQPHLTVDDLRGILRWLDRHFEFLGPQDFLGSQRAGVLLTFDDGFANNAVNVVPLLEEFQAPAVFFASTQHVLAPRDWLVDVQEMAEACGAGVGELPSVWAADLYDGMSVSQLADAARHPLVTFGSHTVSHPLLTSCSDEQLRHELQESRRFIEQITGEPVDLFAYPSGDYDLRVLQAVAVSGYRAAFALDTRRLGELSFEIPRIGIYASHPAYLGSKMSGLHRRALSPTAFDD